MAIAYREFWKGSSLTANNPQLTFISLNWIYVIVLSIVLMVYQLDKARDTTCNESRGLVNDIICEESLSLFVETLGESEKCTNSLKHRNIKTIAWIWNIAKQPYWGLNLKALIWLLLSPLSWAIKMTTTNTTRGIIVNSKNWLVALGCGFAGEWYIFPDSPGSFNFFLCQLPWGCHSLLLPVVLSSLECFVE